MDRRLIVLICSAAMLGFASFPAAAQQNTAKQCNDEWTTNKAAIQASGKTKKIFVAECRGQPTGAATSASKPATTAAPKPPRTAAPSAASNIKTAKQCNDEWTANKAAIQAAKKTKKEFMAECRAQPAGSATATSPPATPPPVAAPSRPSTAAAPSPPPATRAPARQPSIAAASATPPPPTSVAPTGAGQFSTEAQAKARCPGDTVVLVNLDSKIYHFAGTRNYGTTKSGAYMCEKDATSARSRAAKNEKRP
jgi:hypothetical protein